MLYNLPTREGSRMLLLPLSEIESAALNRQEGLLLSPLQLRPAAADRGDCDKLKLTLIRLFPQKQANNRV